jgi:hypothetical protein
MVFNSHRWTYTRDITGPNKTYVDDGVITRLWNIGLVRDYTELCPRIVSSSYSQLWDPEILHDDRYLYCYVTSS